jgi:glycyl-tRNA synthetase
MSMAQELYDQLTMRHAVDFDVAGAIGRRYRRQDEIGTPFCITVDYDSLDDSSVTVRLRDTTEQIRMPMAEVAGFLSKEIDGF